MSALNMLMSAAGAGGAADKLYVDDVFSAFLRTGTGADVTVTTGIDMTKGYMLWSKGRSGATDHAVYDSARGVTYDLATNSTAAQTTQAQGLKSVSSTGHTIGSLAKMNTSGATYVDFVFRKAPKFFDVVKWTGDGTGNRWIPHDLGCAPGMIIATSIDTSTNWSVVHRANGTNYVHGYLNLTNAMANQGWPFGEKVGTETQFNVGTNWLPAANTNGATYVAYLFAHDPSADGMIQCGTFTTDTSGNATVNLGWEPQWVLLKKTNGTDDWDLIDTMRGWSNSGSVYLRPNASSAETTFTAGSLLVPTATGFVSASGLSTSSTYIYLAIRRPNKPPTSGTEVYKGIYSGGPSTIVIPRTEIGFDADLAIRTNRNGVSASAYNHQVFDRLRGFTGTGGAVTSSPHVKTSYTNAETDAAALFTPDGRGGFNYGTSWVGCDISTNFFRRAPGVFDEVCYTGTGTATTVAHNLTKAPELILAKNRGTALGWQVYSAALGATKNLVLNTNAAAATASTTWNNTAPSASVFSVGPGDATNQLNGNLIAYLFATLAGISKVGQYTGNGSTQTIDCGFSTGARFVLIKRTDATGDWYVWDSVRGILAANDPHLSLNTTAAEVTTDDSVDPYAPGFAVNQNTATNINVNGASYIFLSIA